MYDLLDELTGIGHAPTAPLPESTTARIRLIVMTAALATIASALIAMISWG